jgi:FtsP/CotA-like multicopper oxidase with cupredoxin domain
MRILLAGLLLGTSAAWADNLPGSRRPELAVPSPESFTAQCPGAADPQAVCISVACGDGFVKMADGADVYTFGFQTADPDPLLIWQNGRLGAEFPAPTIWAKEGQHLYLTLSNIGMIMRPDLFDPHTIHFHGFPNAASVFDGEPMASFGISQNSSITYFYDLQEPGTFMYHCHQEASEHMQMGMLGNLYILPAQDDLPDGTALGAFIHHAGYKYAYDDGDGSTYYDAEVAIQISGFDPVFHDADLGIQPPPFATMVDVYPLLNGRGYPDTVNPGGIMNNRSAYWAIPDKVAQKIPALVTVAHGKKILLRISSLATTEFNTLTAPGLPMKVVGTGAHLLRGPDNPDGSPGKNLYYFTQTIDLGGGESADVLVDTSTVPAGTYFIYSTNLKNLNNNHQDYGGMMTEFVVTP